MSKPTIPQPQEIEALRKKMLAMSYHEASIEIAKLHSVVTMPVLVAICTQLKQRHETAMELALQQLNGYPTAISINKVIATLLGDELDALIKSYVESESLMDLNAHSIKQKVNELYQQFCEQSPYGFLLRQEKEAAQSFSSLFRNQAFITLALNYYQTADRWQHAGKFSLMKELGFYLRNGEYMRKPYLALTHLVTEVQVNADDTAWMELQWWLHGIYLNAYCPLPKDAQGKVLMEKDGTYPANPDDPNDVNFKYYFLVSKFDIGLYHEETATKLSEKLVAVKEQVATAPLTTAPLSTVPLEAPVKRVQVMVELEEPSLEAFTQLNRQSFKVFNMTALPAHSHTLFAKPGAVNTHGVALSVLKKYEHASQRVKFSAMVADIEKYGLNDAQYGYLQKIKPTIVEELNNYLHSLLSTHWVPTQLKQRTHSDLVKEKSKRIVASDDPKVVVQHLFDLWQELETKGKTTKQFLSDLLETVYIHLKNGAEELPLEVTHRHG